MKGDETNRTKSSRIHRLRRRTFRRQEKMTPFHDGRHPDKSRIRYIPPDPPELELSPHDLGADMMQALLGHPFPRQDDLEIFTDVDGLIRATVPHHAKHYVPDAIKASDSEQYQAGPGAAGHLGIYELALSIMVCYLPAGFDGERALIMGTGRPGPEPIPVSRTAWELHRDFAEDIIIYVDPANSTIPASNIYQWVYEKRPDLGDLLFAEPTPDPLDGLF